MRQIVHVEIPSADNDAQKAFYGSLLGWQATDIPMGPDFTYTMFDLGNNMGAALSELSDDVKPGDVILYFHSDDLDADMARVGELGGHSLAAAAGYSGFWLAGDIHGSNRKPSGILAERESGQLGPSPPAPLPSRQRGDSDGLFPDGVGFGQLVK